MIMHPFVSGLIFLGLGLFLILGSLWLRYKRDVRHVLLTRICLIAGAVVVCVALIAFYFSLFDV
ncbi:hypothetical protein SE17_36615 [Kouleothrix aurantiaca]|uniref:Uncharacterized protein n=1 Tax=Kouleothrix aurantiaca TaxID=186479 RepID=A0A0P9EWM1_9CHLR|nr:hypothetical protein SE17_36615 [Kouleothrix aurantiaca]